MPILAYDNKGKKLGEELFFEFSPTEHMFLKKFDFSESDITDS